MTLHEVTEQYEKYKSIITEHQKAEIEIQKLRPEPIIFSLYDESENGWGTMSYSPELKKFRFTSGDKEFFIPLGVIGSVKKAINDFLINGGRDGN